MKDRWMLFNKNNKLECWIAFPTKEHADSYRLIGQDHFLIYPYYADGTVTAHGKRYAPVAVKNALRMRDEVRAVRVKLTKVAN